MATSPNCNSEQAKWETVSFPDATKTSDASGYIGKEVAAQAKIACASSAETCGHSINPNTCDSVDKQDFAYELSVETDKLLQTLEKIFQSIEQTKNLSDLSSMIKSKSYDDGGKYTGFAFNIDEFDGYVEIEEHIYWKDITEVRLFVEQKSDKIEGEKEGPSIACYFDTAGKPLEIVFWSPLSLNFSAQCVRQSTMYDLRGDYSVQIDKDPYTI
ncbi:hypothetical protein HZA40_05070 [Candidatus Peregrinibacteria bacterium]|nr:hypothetical protein [Candidatus Peregrinibacteria bacterium]